MNPSFNNVQLLIQIQIALVGVILVGGLFFLWRAVCRLDDKIDHILMQINKPNVREEMPINFEQINKATEQLINKVFVEQIKEDDEDDENDDDDDINDTTFVVFTHEETIPMNEVKGNISIEDVDPVEAVLKEEEKVKSLVLDKESVAPSEELSNPLSKSKLNKMHVDELKKLCEDRGLSVDGHKMDLVNRLMGIVRD